MIKVELTALCTEGGRKARGGERKRERERACLRERCRVCLCVYLYMKGRGRVCVCVCVCVRERAHASERMLEKQIERKEGREDDELHPPPPHPQHPHPSSPHTHTSLELLACNLPSTLSLWPPSAPSSAPFEQLWPPQCPLP